MKKLKPVKRKKKSSNLNSKNPKSQVDPNPERLFRFVRILRPKVNSRVITS